MRRLANADISLMITGEVTLQRPQLHEHSGDALLIAHVLFKKWGDGEALKLTKSAVDAIESWYGPGNARELEKINGHVCWLIRAY